MNHLLVIDMHLAGVGIRLQMIYDFISIRVMKLKRIVRKRTGKEGKDKKRSVFQILKKRRTYPVDQSQILQPLPYERLHLL
jgi:hypothetical protein